MKNPAGQGGADHCGDRFPHTPISRDLKAALANTRQPHIDRLRSLGVSPAALATLGTRQLPFGAMTIDTDDAGRWWPDAEGFAAMVVPVRERGDDIDVIAFRTAAPARWWWRIGCASMLGADLLDRTFLPGDRLHVVSTPIGWIAAAGEAVCVLDWDCPDYELSPLRDRDELVCDSPMLAARLRKRLTQPRRVPSITYTKEARVA